MRTNSWIYLAAMLVCGLGAADTALAQTASQRAERQLALTEASQTIQRFFTCIGEGVNSAGDPARDARAISCLRDNLHPDAVVVFNGIPLVGADVIVATFTGQGPAAQQFANTILDVHTIVDKEFQRGRFGIFDARIKLRVTVVTTFTNTITTPVLPLPPGNFIFHAAEDFELEEEQPGRWVINRVDVRPLSNIPIPENSFPTPFPVLPGVQRNP
jgi:hypothetical protein